MLPTRSRRLGVTGRRAVLVTHIAAAGAWLGVDVAMAVLIVTVALTADPITRAVSLQALELVTVGPLLACGLVCLLVYPPTVSPALLLVAMTLSVVKPWGRIRTEKGSVSPR